MKKRMNNLKVVFTLAILLIGFGLVQAGSNLDEKAEVPLTNPSKIANVKISAMMGSVFVTGYSGKTILVETKKAVVEKGDDHMDVDVEMDDDKDDKAKGMFVIENSSSGLSIVEENNKVVIRTRRYTTRFDLHIKVPFKCNLSVRSTMARKVVIKNVSGNIVTQNSNGAIRLENISGTAIANTHNGEVFVTFDKIDLNNPMSFTTMNGSVDVSFPANAKFDVALETEMGKIYSDYKLEVQKAPAAEKNIDKKEKGRYQIRFNSGIYAKLNGGGKKITFKTMNGNIYLRKKK